MNDTVLRARAIELLQTEKRRARRRILAIVGIGSALIGLVLGAALL